MKKIIALVLTLALMAAAVAAVAEDAAPPGKLVEKCRLLVQDLQRARGAGVGALMAVGAYFDGVAVPELRLDHGGEAAADEAQAAAEALSEALTAWQNARAETRKQAILDSLKQELDACVTAGTLTQEQADLILKYYT